MKIAVIAGDGIGPEVIAQSLQVLRALRPFGFEFSVKAALAGASAFEQCANPLPESTVNIAMQSDAVLFGAVDDARYDHVDRALRPEQAILGLRKQLGLYASLRQVKIEPELASLSPPTPERVRGLDLLIVRELSGDVYMGTPRGQRVIADGPGGGEREGFDTMRYCESEVRRVAQIAFDAARARSKCLYSVDKANVLETSRLWRQVVTEVDKDYPDIAVTHQCADNASVQTIVQPMAFDTNITGNPFGDLLSDAASALTGSVGLAASAMFGSTGPSLYEAGHGSAPNIAGQDRANPIACIRAATLMLRHAGGRHDLANRIEASVQQVLRQGLRTADIYRPGTRLVGTRQMGEAIACSIGQP
ncbi:MULTISPECIES: 3-isopropylmalate dehydrogenase [Burkholderiaceae]|uniref:3-isopropylmalate dehydrogenase n=1 Tax=Caballeronia sordidicola TaxID=196367 RepID=A0A242MTC0_CABSO|nr:MULTISPECIES: 3-isopropylmalate dehydrogenase [Burkholderiaceae]AME25552.1 3-isopropylmalate dehydrogenase [Burkholderia sp. PAMC 26561]OTP74634.1 3-isopropylmalate dehydrogenase [Caballeronia sordidicola]